MRFETKKLLGKAIAALFCTCAGGLLFLGCAAQIEPPLRVGAIVRPGYEPFFLGRALGKFEQTGIKLVEYPSTPEVIRSFQNGAIEAAAMTADEFLRLAAEDPDARVVLIIDYSKGADALVARSQFRCVKDLKGHRIGVEPNALGVFMLPRALASAGLTAKDVEVVPLANDQHAAAFEGGKVDALITFEPHRSKLLERGAHVLYDSAQIPGEIIDCLVVHKSLLESRRKTLRTLIQAWFDARAYLNQQPGDACEKTARRERVTARQMEQSLSLIEIPSLEKNRELLGISRAKTYATFKKLHQEMLGAGISPGALPGPEIFDGGLLP